MGGALNHVFVHAAEGQRPGGVAPAGIFPPSFEFDVSFWVLDEALYTPSDTLAVTIAADDCVRSVNLQDEIFAVPRDSRISQGAVLRSVVYRIQYQSNTGPESRESMLSRHDRVRAQLAAKLFPSILVRGSTRFQEPFVEKIMSSPGRERVVHLKGFGSGLSEIVLFDVAFPLVVSEIERIAALENDLRPVKILWDGDNFRADSYTAIIPKLAEHFASSSRVQLSLCACRCRNQNGRLDPKYEEGSPESEFEASWKDALGETFDLEVRPIGPPDGFTTWTEVGASSDAWYTIWATLGARVDEVGKRGIVDGD
eukprot:g1708.t1